MVQSSAKTVVKEEKATIPASSLLVGAIIGGLFTTLALVDVSVLSYGPAPFIGQYYIWKQNAPILQRLILIISFSIPLAILNNCFTLYHTFTRKATTFRNTCDNLEFLALAAVIVNTIVRATHVEEAIIEAARSADLSLIDELTPTHLITAYINFGLNLVMLILPFIRFFHQENLKESQVTSTSIQNATKHSTVPENTSAITTTAVSGTKSKKTD